MNYDLQTFGLKEMIDAGRWLRLLDGAHHSLEGAAGAVVDFLYDHLRQPDGTRNCVLARCFATHPLGRLPTGLCQRAAALAGETKVSAGLQCLTLMATRGERPEWNDRRRSEGHQVIPLPTVEMVLKVPMLAQLILQLGSKIEDVVAPGAQSGSADRVFDVFHVEDALGSPVVPDQQGFVLPYGVRSVLGFGGFLPAGELFAVILFARVRVTAETAQLFRTLALGVKLTLLPYSGRPAFEPEESQGR